MALKFLGTSHWEVQSTYPTLQSELFKHLISKVGQSDTASSGHRPQNTVSFHFPYLGRAVRPSFPY